MNLTSRIEQLRTLVWEEVNENRILEIGEPIVLDLRQAWKTQRNDFSIENVETLRDLVKKIKAIKAFIEEAEEFPYVSSKEDVDEIVGELFSIVEELNLLNVSGRVNKEIRELLGKRLSMPTRESTNRSSEMKKAFMRLSSDAPFCRRCGEKMVLREGNSPFFWGCSGFPKCWATKSLTDDELKKLPS